MALVNAFQNSSYDSFNHDQQAAEPISRFTKTRSVWPFLVRGNPRVDAASNDLPFEGGDDAVTLSSFIT